MKLWPVAVTASSFDRGDQSSSLRALEAGRSSGRVCLGRGFSSGDHVRGKEQPDRGTVGAGHHHPGHFEINAQIPGVGRTAGARVAGGRRYRSGHSGGVHVILMGVSKVCPYAKSTGSGTAVVLRDGRAQRVRWSQPDSDGGTTYTLPSGAGMTFAPGQVWVVLTTTNWATDGL